MYLLTSVFLIFLFLVLTVGAETERGREHPRVFFYTELALSVIGLLLISATCLFARYSLTGGDLDAEFAEWAWDMLSVYYQLSMIPMTVFFVLSSASFALALLEPKQRGGFPKKLRLSVTVVFSLVMLMIAPMYSFMTVNERVSLDTFVLVSGIGEALFLRTPFLIEYGRRCREKKTSHT